MRDYLSLLRHLLQILGMLFLIQNKSRLNSNSLTAGKANNPILKLETVQSIFVPTISEADCQKLELILSIIPHQPKGTYSWGNSLGINTSDVEGARRKGTGFCTLK